MLVVGQYFPYKGLDVAVEAAKLLPSIQFKFVGMGNRTELFLKETKAEKCANIQAISFLSKTELEREYLACDLLVLPSRQECWGLVINEAASFGMPIVATYGCGAAVEFLFADYACFLAVPDNAEDLAKKIKAVLNMKHPEEYSKFLMKKSESYSIEKSVKCHVEAFYT